MPLTYRIDPAAGLIRIAASERLSITEMERMAQDILADPGYRPGLDVLSDSRELTQAPSTEDIRAASALIVRVTEKGVGRVAVVVTSAGVYGMMGMLHSLADARGGEVEVFTRPDEALAWLAEPRDDTRKKGVT